MIFFSNILEIFCSNIFLTGYISGNNTFPQPLDEKEEASFKNKDQLGSLRFEKEFCKQIYYEGYEIGKNLNISM